VSIDIELIAWITRFLMVGEDLLPLFTDKANEKAWLERMKEKFDMFRGAHRLDVLSINDDYASFVMQVLSCKFLRKCHKDQVLACAIGEMDKCIEGVQLN
jgi:hypothetical protein